VDVVIAGLGLIGGSLGKALRRRGWHVSYVDPHVPLDAARAAGAADEKREHLQAGLIVLATAADVALDLLSELRGTDAVVTSVSSVMKPLRDAASLVSFVAGHPFAGSELHGLAAADATLFERRPWFVDRSHDDVIQMIRAAGAEPAVVDAAEHDRVMALTSHLPQVVATALASLLEGVDPRFIGSGAKSMLRLAGSSYAVWEPILDQNNENISAAAEQLWNAMNAIGADDFERAQALYRREKGDP
jgi:prephenate dehydrogenase